MNQDLLLGRLHRDLACAIGLGFVEDPRVVAGLHALTLHDDALRPLGTIPDWLAGDDPLVAATREYLRARVAAGTASRPGQTAWASAAAAKVRDAANQQARQARSRGRALLAERGVLVHARQAGLALIGQD